MSIVIGAGPLLLDACSVLTLCAAKRVLPALKEAGILCFVVKRVRDEAMFIYRDDNPFSRKKEPLDWPTMIQAGLVTIVERLTDQEESAFVEMAAHMGDGEAGSYAVAISRGWPVVTDDQRSQGFLRRSGADVKILTTPEILRWWSDLFRPDEVLVRSTIERVERCASFRIPNKHYLRDWWTNGEAARDNATAV